MIKTRILALLAVLALLVAVPATVLAQEVELPHKFAGTATLDGNLVAAGVVVTTWIDGKQVATAITTAGGSYVNDVYQPPGGNFTGNTASFTVGGLSATQTATWALGGVTVLNLTAAAQEGVTAFTGTVTINGAAAPAGTTVNVTLQTSGAVIGTGTTGGSIFAANQYRIDIQATSALEGQTVSLVVPGTSQATPATAVFNANTVRTVNTVATTGPVPVLMALAPLINTDHLVLVSSFNYNTALYEAFVPGLPGNSLTEIRPNSVLFINLTQAHTVVVSGNSFTITMNLPTPVPVEASVTITVP